MEREDLSASVTAQQHYRAARGPRAGVRSASSALCGCTRSVPLAPQCLEQSPCRVAVFYKEHTFATSPAALILRHCVNSPNYLILSKLLAQLSSQTQVVEIHNYQGFAFWQLTEDKIVSIAAKCLLEQLLERHSFNYVGRTAFNYFPKSPAPLIGYPSFLLVSKIRVSISCIDSRTQKCIIN